MHNVKHAAKLLEAVKSVSASDEQYIANVEIDEAVFENAKPCDIAMIESIMVEDKEKIGFGGSTFAWKDKLKVLRSLASSTRSTSSGSPRPQSPDLDGLLDKMEDYGFPPWAWPRSDGRAGEREDVWAVSVV